MQESQPFFHHDLILPVRLTTRHALHHLDQRDDLSVSLAHMHPHANQQLVLIHLFLSLRASFLSFARLFLPQFLFSFSLQPFCGSRAECAVFSRKLSALFLLSSVLLGLIKWNKGKLGHEPEAFQMRGETIHFLYYTFGVSSIICIFLAC